MDFLRKKTRSDFKTKACSNVIIFGEPQCAELVRRVTRLAIESIGGSLHDASTTSTIDSSVAIPDPSLEKVFDTMKHRVATRSDGCYIFYETIGLPMGHFSDVEFDPRSVLRSMYRFTNVLAGRINLLIYVVPDEPSRENYNLFRDYLCQKVVPIILVGPDPQNKVDGFEFAGIVNLSSDPPKMLRKTIIQYQNAPESEEILPIDRFLGTAIQSWNLLDALKLEVTESNIKVVYRNALTETLIEDALFSKAYALEKQEEITNYIQTHYFRNVIVFGETGAGKTSVIRMLLDEDQAKRVVHKNPNAPTSSTMEHKHYRAEIQGHHYRIHDTIGLNDATTAKEAMRGLYELICKIEGGISLLVYVHRGRMGKEQVMDYRVFQKVVCEGKVPTLLVVTGLEEEEDLGGWWTKYGREFATQKMDTEHYACITSTKGLSRNGLHVYQTEYDNATRKLKGCIDEASRKDPWKATDTTKWMNKVIVQVYNSFASKFNWPKLVGNNALFDALVAMDIPSDMAREKVNELIGVAPQSTNKSGRR